MWEWELGMITHKSIVSSLASEMVKSLNGVMDVYGFIRLLVYRFMAHTHRSHSSAIWHLTSDVFTLKQKSPATSVVEDSASGF